MIIIFLLTIAVALSFVAALVAFLASLYTAGAENQKYAALFYLAGGLAALSIYELVKVLKVLA